MYFYAETARKRRYILLWFNLAYLVQIPKNFIIIFGILSKNPLKVMKGESPTPLR